MRLLITNFYSSLLLDMNANICPLDRLTFTSIRVRCSLKGKVKRTITVEHVRHHEGDMGEEQVVAVLGIRVRDRGG
jgi:hypothetical protein